MADFLIVRPAEEPTAIVVLGQAEANADDPDAALEEWKREHPAAIEERLSVVRWDNRTNYVARLDTERVEE